MSKHGTVLTPVFTVKGQWVEHKNLEVLVRYARRFGAGKMLTPVYDVPAKRYTLFEYRQY